METQENKSKEQPAVEASEEVNEQQLESVQGGGLTRLPTVATLSEFTRYNLKRTASEAGMIPYDKGPNKMLRIRNMKDESGLSLPNTSQRESHLKQE
jgi:hypothetical protein